jgi:hypothetical protein
MAVKVWRRRAVETLLIVSAAVGLLHDLSVFR